MPGEKGHDSIGGGLWNTGYGSNPVSGGGIWGSSGVEGMMLSDLFPLSITSYPTGYNRHFFRDRGTRKGKFRTRKKINDY